MFVAEGADDCDANEYEMALLEVRLGELAAEVREVYRRVLSLDDRVERAARPDHARTRPAHQQR